ncbi:hypothetical protein LMH73_015635 [Vibrio splendidus]|nr:hypothetical protein [Vibrio splendidus]MCC4883200.1 hypothetical protein [Vibrio splendidus]
MNNINHSLSQMHRTSIFNDYVEKKVEQLLPSFLDDSLQPSQTMETLLPRISERIAGQISHIHHSGDMYYKEVFAHCHCYYLVNGLMSLLSKADCEPESLVMTNKEGEAAHYLVRATIAGKLCYIDAYGIHSNLEMITTRYRDTEIMNTVVFDHCDDGDPYYQAFIDKNCDLYDMVEGVLEVNNLETETDNTVDFLEFIEEALALEVFGYCLTHDIQEAFEG